MIAPATSGGTSATASTTARSRRRRIMMIRKVGHPGASLSVAAPTPSAPVRSAAVLAEAVLRWYGREARDLPWRRTRDPYAILVSEVMLQQTQVARVVPRYEAWLARWPDATALAAAPLADVLAAWVGLGHNRRAVRLREAC